MVKVSRFYLNILLNRKKILKTGSLNNRWMVLDARLFLFWCSMVALVIVVSTGLAPLGLRVQVSLRLYKRRVLCSPCALWVSLSFLPLSKGVQSKLIGVSKSSVEFALVCPKMNWHLVDVEKEQEKAPNIAWQPEMSQHWKQTEAWYRLHALV